MARLEAKVERLESLVSAKERELSALTRTVGLKSFGNLTLIHYGNRYLIICFRTCSHVHETVQGVFLLTFSL